MPKTAATSTGTKNSNGVSSSVSGGTSTHCAAKMTGVTARRAKIPAVGRAPLNGALIQPKAPRSAADHRKGFCARAHGQHPAWTTGIVGGRQTMIMLIDTPDAGWTGHG
jgi:hypothetical protein